MQNDILDLADKISKFRNLQIDDDKFRSIRLARGIYGQRQEGVQMIRIKIPYGKMTTRQLRRIADLADEYVPRLQFGRKAEGGIHGPHDRALGTGARRVRRRG